MENDVFEIIDQDQDPSFLIESKPDLQDTITFFIKGEPIIELRPDGDIFIKGKLAENDKEVVEGMRWFIRNYFIL